jgi:aspartate aminotransferase
MKINDKVSKMLRNVSQGQRSNKAFSNVSPGVIKLNSGDPSFLTPLHIREAAHKAMNDGYTHYCPGLGDKELRENICNALEKDYGIKMLADEILITNGAAGAIFLTAVSFLDEGDEAIVFDPSYSLYTVGIRAARATPIPVPLSPSFHYNEKELLERITSKTKLIFINNPNNPTATCFSREDLDSIAVIANKYNLLIVADEVYHKLLFEGRNHICAGSIEELKGRLILINSFSKTYAMTGWRIGYIAANREITKSLIPLNRALTGSVNTISQRAALAALQLSQKCVLEMKKQYEERRKIIYQLASSIKGLECSLPEGAFYIFCKFKYNFTSEEMVNYLMKQSVAVRSGTEFGQMGEKYIRITFAASLETIEKGMEKIDKALKLLG